MRIAISCAGVVDRKGYARNLCLARGLTKLGHDLTLLICNDKFRFERIRREGVKLVLLPELVSYRLRKGGLGLIDLLSRMPYMFMRQFDLVHADVGFRPASGIPAHLYSFLRDVPYVCDWWDWVGKGGMLDYRSSLYQHTLGAMDNYFEIWDKQHANGVVTISHLLQERAMSLGIPKERTRVIHGGADTWQKIYQPPRALREEIGMDPSAFVVGFAGMGPHEYVSLIPFLESVPQLKRRFPKFQWFSTGDSMPAHALAQHGVGEEYIDFGWLPYEQYGKHLAAANVLLLPMSNSTVDAARWPNKFGDYLAAGRPIIGSNVGEIARFSELYPGSVILAGDAPQEIGDAIVGVAENPVAAEEIGRRNLEIALTRYSWDHKAQELEDFYRQIHAA